MVTYYLPSQGPHSKGEIIMARGPAPEQFGGSHPHVSQPKRRVQQVARRLMYVAGEYLKWPKIVLCQP